jgi:hypothetical protein
MKHYLMLYVQAIDEPENCALYATLCCHVIEEACMDSRRFIRHGLSSAFKIKQKSCKDVSTEAGVLPYMRTARQHQGLRRLKQRLDVKVRDRTHGTCR